MAIEIERKFLVHSDQYKKDCSGKVFIKQGFLNSNKERTVRIRVANKKAFITVKGCSSASGLTRYEWEKEIPLQDGNELLTLCEKEIIEKTRYHVLYKGFLYEVDEFLGSNIGLTVAEIELNHETEHFEKPEWLGQEITGKTEYYNSQLSKNPFTKWKR